MSRVTIYISILFFASTVINAKTPPLIISGIESQKITPIITENPDQTIHLQPDHPPPSQLNSSNTPNPTTPNTGTAPNSMDEQGNTTNNPSINNSTVDSTTPTSVDESGNTTNDTDVNTNLSATPSGTTSSTTEETDNQKDINTNLNNTTKGAPGNSKGAPAVSAPPALNNDSGTANDSPNGNKPAIVNPKDNTSSIFDSEDRIIFDNEEEPEEDDDIFFMDNVDITPPESSNQTIPNSQ
ncbi:Uncharacterised protein [Legionella busanensis]|uniref:Uncharacterized protein n=1 Tax=Legionella busanensis TaxID=190655 RepID=A0A378JFS0_9GAMM|nr:hypothetical protein [Legionella busanensis]STX50025.1 Uncharacterised protein [Legionella busanensis]